MIRPNLSEPPFRSVRLLAAPDLIWSAHADTVAALGFERGEPALHWCHPSGGEKGTRKLPALPTAARLSSDGRLLAFAVDERVQVIDLFTGTVRLSDVAAFGTPVERLWIDVTVGRLWAQAVDGSMVRWDLPERDGEPSPRSDIWSLGVTNRELQDQAMSGASKLVPSSDGSAALAWGDDGRGALVDVTGKLAPRELQMPPGTAAWDFPPSSASLIRACLTQGDCTRLLREGVAAREVEGKEEELEFVAQGRSMWKLRVTSGELHRPNGKVTKLIDRPREQDVLLIGAMALSPNRSARVEPGTALFAGLAFGADMTRQMKDGNLPPAMVPSRAGVSATNNNQKIFDSQVPTRPNLTQGHRWEGAEFVLVGQLGNVVRRIPGVYGLVWAVAVDADRVLLQTGKDELSICPLRRQGPCNRLALGLDEPLQAVAMTPDGQLIATGSASGVTLRMASGELLTRIPLSLLSAPSGDARRTEADSHPIAVALSRDGRALYALSVRGHLRTWAIDPTEQTRSLQERLATDGSVGSASKLTLQRSTGLVRTR